MSLVKWEEPKPCALSKPRFVKVPVRNAEGIIVQPVTYRMKRRSAPTCASGDPAVSSVSVNGTIYHLCLGCGRQDVIAWLDERVTPTLPPAMTEPMAQDGDTILVRIGRDTMALGRALANRGWAMQPRTRTVRATGCEPSRVQVWKPA